MAEYHVNALGDALRRCGGHRFLGHVGDQIASSAAAIASELRQAVMAVVPEYSQSRNPDLLPELMQHGQAHVVEIIRLLRGGAAGHFEFVHQHARRRAEQHFPLEATLHAYRSSHKVLARWLRESVLSIAVPAAATQTAVADIADFAMEYTDAVSTMFAGTYAAQSLLLAEVAGDQRSQLLQILLDGHDEADMRAASLLREAGLTARRAGRDSAFLRRC
jgi:peptidoglycan/xylan/chitin deacetylase (PgdA/CDA1 family)